MDDTITFRTAAGKSVTALYIPPGAPYMFRKVRSGEWSADRVHEQGLPPMVEFYDREAGQRFGQFFARYYLSSLNYALRWSGLVTHTEIPQWTIDGRSMHVVLAWLDALAPGEIGADERKLRRDLEDAELLKVLGHESVDRGVRASKRTEK